LRRGRNADAGNATEATSGNLLRRAAHDLGRRVATRLDAYWRTSGRAPNGPVDVVDLFSGCGGMSAGLLALNAAFPAYRIAAAVDVDPVANASYASNMGITPFREDVASLARNTSKLLRLLRSGGRRDGHPRVLIGCAPCQGFSSHRNSDGEADGRNSLFLDFARIAAGLKPDAIVVENVPELLTERYWPFVREARALLSRAGYHVHVAVHNMAEFGVPQERFRTLLLGMRKPFTAPNAMLRRGRFRTVRDATGALPPLVAGGRDAQDELHYTVTHRASTLETIRAVPKDGGSRPPDVGPACLRRMHARQGKAGYEDVYGRLHWDRPSITVTAYARNPASGRFVHPEQDRGLSVREAALLQGFPMDYRLAGSLDERFRQVGNAVPPIFSA
jgi:DNA (cytosine-5)-methyltransferase 1